MTVQRLLKRVHLVGTIWFGLCVRYVLILSLREAGVRWWVIFSLSGPSAVVAFVLLSLYLLAIYKGASRSEKTELEYPLSSTGASTMLPRSWEFWRVCWRCSTRPISHSR